MVRATRLSGVVFINELICENEWFFDDGYMVARSAHALLYFIDVVLFYCKAGVGLSGKDD